MKDLNNLTNLEIAEIFNEKDSFVQNVLDNLADGYGKVNMGYVIFAEDHEPLNDTQRKVMDLYGYGEELELFVSIDILDLLGNGGDTF